MGMLLPFDLVIGARRLRRVTSCSLLWAVALASQVSRGDFVEFLNGNRVEGVIVEETQTEVRIKVGLGTVTFPKSQLRTVSRDAAINASLHQRWQEEYFDAPQLLPPDLHSLAQDYRDLASRKPAAVLAQRQVQQTREEAARGEAEARQIDQRRVEILALLSKMKASGDVLAYNRLVLTNNDLVARRATLESRYGQLEAIESTNRTVVSAYMTALGRVRNEVEAGRARRLTNEAARVFFEKAGQQLAAMVAALEEVKIPMNIDAGGHAVATARVNDKADARLMVDTGASFVCFYAASAARLQLRWDTNKTVRVTLADGSTIQVHPIVLDSLSVGGARLSRVAAAVIPSAQTKDEDGLLGMSFLREFDVQIDPTRKQVFLRRLPMAQ